MRIVQIKLQRLQSFFKLQRKIWKMTALELIRRRELKRMLNNRKDNLMEDFNISTTIGMEGIPLAAREAAVSRMPSLIEKQAAVAAEESSVIIFLVDGQSGLTAADVEIADWLRRNFSDKNIILAVNKCESPRKGLYTSDKARNCRLIIESLCMFGGLSYIHLLVI